MLRQQCMERFDHRTENMFSQQTNELVIATFNLFHRDVLTSFRKPIQTALSWRGCDGNKYEEKNPTSHFACDSSNSQYKMSNGKSCFFFTHVQKTDSRAHRTPYNHSKIFAGVQQ